MDAYRGSSPCSRVVPRIRGYRVFERMQDGTLYDRAEHFLRPAADPMSARK
jgi:hypothetical protein